MSRLALQCLFLTIIVGLAGCSGLLGQNQAPTTAPPATTKPHSTTHPVTKMSPPGIENQTLTKPMELVTAHSRILENVSYTAHSNASITYPNGTIAFQQNFTSRISANHTNQWSSNTITAINGTWTILEPTGRQLDTWSNKSVRVFRLKHVNGTTTYATSHQERFTIQRMVSNYRLYLLLSALNPSVTRADGRVTLTAANRTPSNGSDVIEQSLPRHMTHVSNVSFRTVVRPSGLIRSYSLSYEAHWHDQTVTVHQTNRWTRLNRTTVSRPAWVSTATNQTQLGGN